MKTILQAIGVTKAYGKTTILRDVDLEIREGECVSVMGPSGSGKTTLLYSITGMDTITKGSVKLNGKELSTLTEKQLSEVRLYQMGFIFQESHLLKNLSIFDNIVISAYLAKKKSRNEINRKALELMRKMGIDHLTERDVTQASGGELQRVAICRALINNPLILFGDEPTGALNTKSTSEIIDILTRINELGTTILFVTHDIKVASKTDRVLFMIDGKIVGEKRLGKYNRVINDTKVREETLASWLRDLGY